MPKYQIIIETDEQMADDEFKKMVKENMEDDSYGSPFMGKYTRVISAMNLEGIRPEVYDPAADLL